MIEGLGAKWEPNGESSQEGKWTMKWKLGFFRWFIGRV